MVLDRDKLKKLLKEKGVKDLDDFNAFMRDVSKDVIETLLDEIIRNSFLAYLQIPHNFPHFPPADTLE